MTNIVSNFVKLNNTPDNVNFLRQVINFISKIFVALIALEAGALILIFAAIPQVWLYPHARLQFMSLTLWVLLLLAITFVVQVFLRDLSKIVNVEKGHCILGFILTSGIICGFAFFVLPAFGNVSDIIPCLYQDLPQCVQLSKHSTP